MIDRMSEDVHKPSGKRMQSQDRIRPSPWAQTPGQNTVQTLKQQSYANHGVQPRVQQIKPQGAQINFGDYQADLRSNAQISYGKPASG